MGRNLVIIISITAVLSFVSGKLAGKRTMNSIDASMTSILQSIEVAEEIHKMNKNSQKKSVGPSTFGNDPQL
jgi:hypothetical protein